MENPTNEYIQSLCDMFRSADIADVELAIQLINLLNIDNIELRQLKKLSNCVNWGKMRVKGKKDASDYGSMVHEAVSLENRIRNKYNERKVKAFRDYASQLTIKESEKYRKKYYS